MRETEKVSTGNEASQPIGVKHVATTYATLPVSHQCRTESQASPKKKKKGRGKDIYIHIKYLNYTQPKYVHPCESKTNLLIFLHPSEVWTTPGIGGQLTGPAKPPVSSRVMIKDE